MASRLVCCLYFATNHKLLVASADIFAVARHGKRSWGRYCLALYRDFYSVSRDSNGEQVPSESARPGGFILLANDADEVYNAALEAIAAAGRTAAGLNTSCSSWFSCTSKKKGRTVAAAAITPFSPPKEDFSSLFLPSRSPYVTSSSYSKRKRIKILFLSDLFIYYYYYCEQECGDLETSTQDKCQSRLPEHIFFTALFQIPQSIF